MKRRAGPSIALAILLAVPLTAAGQSPDHAPLLLQLTSGPVPRALGGAFPLHRPTSDALFAHPALLADAAGVGASTRIYGEEATAASASGAREWWSGGAAAGVRILTYTLPGTPPTTVPSEADLFTEGPRSVSEIAASAGYARSILGVDVGVAGAWVERTSGQDLDRTVTADVGLAKDAGPGRLALTVRNLGGDLDADDPDGGELPTAVVAGLGFGREDLGPLDVGAAAELGRRADGELIAGGGLEVAWWPIYGRTFVGRIGYRTSPETGIDPLTLGAAFEGDDIRIVYAWQGVDGDRGIHTFGLGWR